MLRAIGISRENSRAIGGWVVIFVMMIMFGEAYLRNSMPAAVALNFTAHNAVVQKAVGGTVQARLNWIGHIHYEDDDGWASFALRITGARTNATMDLTLHRQSGHWNVASGHLVTDSGEVVEVTGQKRGIEQAYAASR